jgi:hypothetical protein
MPWPWCGTGKKIAGSVSAISPIGLISDAQHFPKLLKKGSVGRNFKFHSKLCIFLKKTGKMFK